MSPRNSLPVLAGKLARDFAPASPVARQLVAALYAALARLDSAHVAAALTHAAGDVADARGRPGKQSPGLADLAESYGLLPEPTRQADLLLAVQTYYALLVEAVCSRAIPGSELRGTATAGLPEWFVWYRVAGCGEIVQLTGSVADRLREYDREELLACAGPPNDLLGYLYQRLFPRRLRHAAGEYYTPPWLAGEMLDQVGFTAQGGQRLLDPACGSGTFLLLAIRRLRSSLGGPGVPPVLRTKHGQDARATPREAILQRILASVVGFDRNPLAVLTARANYLLALGELPSDGPIEVPVYCLDSILGPALGEAPECGRFDCVVGNPPWIAWDNLPAEYRDATKPLWQKYGLFSLSGSDARHGGGKKDLSMLMTYVAADRFLKDSGRLALVITQSVFQTKGAGDGFRRFRLGADGPWLRVLRVNDLVALRPFPGAANWTATILLEKGSPTTYPVPYVRWLPGSRQEQYEARPADPSRPTSPWFLWPQEWKDAERPLTGPSEYDAHLGANSGGANGVYWVTLVDQPGTSCATASQKPCPPPSSTACLTAGRGTPTCVWIQNAAGRGKHSLPTVEHLVEAELLFPLLRWADVSRYRAVPRDWWLFVQDAQTRKGIAEDAMLREYPHALAYLERFRQVLSGRAAYRRYQSRAPYYSMYDVGPYTLAPIKIVWRRMDRCVTAAVVEPVDHPVLGPRPVIPQETCVLVAAESLDEAHYLCALLNSAVVGFLVSSHSVRGGKGFGTPSMLDYLGLRRFDPGNAAHGELALLSQEAHCRAARGEDWSDLQSRIDCVAAPLWGIQGVVRGVTS